MVVDEGPDVPLAGTGEFAGDGGAAAGVVDDEQTCCASIWKKLGMFLDIDMRVLVLRM